MIQPFSFSQIPHIYFGAGTFNSLTNLISAKAQTVLVVTGSRFLRSTEKWSMFLNEFSHRSITCYDISVRGEPSPELVDNTVSEFKNKSIEMVVSIGGGSVIDAGKAISAMLTQTSSVINFIEGVGTGIKHSGDKVPFIAVPTTAGTGSEATKNAVLSRIGKNGFKKSLRHDNFVPDSAVIDPELMLPCPPSVTAYCGMDAFTQLLESYVSTKANPISDALAFSGMKFVKDSLLEAYNNGGSSLEAREGMGYAALMSGLTLVNAGLGIVHGLASPIGGHFNIPHGVVCGTLFGPATRVTINKLKASGSAGVPYLKKYAKAGALFSGCDSNDIDRLCDNLVKTIEEWTESLQIQSLKDYNIKVSDFDIIIDGAANKNNPVELDRDEIKEILLSRV